MLRLSAVLAVAGCAAAPGITRDEPLVLEDPGLLPVELPRMRDPDPAQAVGAYQVRELPVRTGLVHGIHGSMVEETVLTEDGRVAVTLAGNGLRLWPSLDGKHEPVAIAPAPGSGLQIVRDGDDLVIAGLELTGAIGLVRTTALGEQRARLEIIAPRPIIAIRATPHGLLALRDDQVIELVDLRGGRRGVLVPEPGERISSIAQRSGHTLALLATPDGVRGRWIVASGSGLAWGEATPMLAIDPSRVALSPDGVHVAAVRAGRAGPAGPAGPAGMVYVNLATGRAIDIPPAESVFGPELVESVHPLGFTDRHTLAFATQFGALAWWNGETSTRSYITPSHSRSEFVERDVTAGVGDGHAVVGASSFIVVDKPGESHSYGYELPAMPVSYPHGDGWLLADDEHAAFLEIDGRFRLRRRIALPAALVGVTNMVLLDQRHAAVIAGDSRTRTLYRVDLEGEQEAEAIGSVEGYAIQYSRATHLIAISGYREHTFAHVDPMTGAIGTLVRQTLSNDTSQTMTLVDPTRNNGVIAYEDIYRREGTHEIVEVRAICETCDEPVRIGRRRVLPQNEARSYSNLAAPTIRADHEYAASTDGWRMRLVDRTGAERWALPARGIIGAFDWSQRGELVAHGNGLAHVDLATGAILDGQCGWQFGELAEPPRDNLGSASVCDLE